MLIFNTDYQHGGNAAIFFLYNFTANFKTTSDEGSKNNHLRHGTPKDPRSVVEPQDYGLRHSQTPAPLPRNDCIHESGKSISRG